MKAAEAIVSSMMPDESEMSDEEKLKQVQDMKESEASSIVDAIKRGEASRLARCLSRFYELCEEAKEYEEAD